MSAALFDFKDPEAVGELGPALDEGVETGTEDDVLGDAGGGLLGNEILAAFGVGGPHTGPSAPNALKCLADASLNKPIAQRHP
jgi:hypothetical protein